MNEFITTASVWLNYGLTMVLVLIGGFFSIMAAVGLLRMPDVYTRMQAATKAGTLGVGCMVLAVATHFTRLDVILESILVIGMLFITAPIASHLIARAAYFTGAPLWDKTAYDEMRGCYDADSHVLHNKPGQPPQDCDSRPSLIAGRTSREIMSDEDDEDMSDHAKTGRGTRTRAG
ncbi:MAG: monovalent cation/H(+) antiporter subunit G [Phycisphaeraceae bacterium]|nr:monovalent cation/H(+) antiporter subunit G [Phycisphaeraceae bacterium]